VLHHASIPGSQGLFAQLWKEYALSDSRYMVSDPFMLCIESLTVVCSHIIHCLRIYLIFIGAMGSTLCRHRDMRRQRK
jgi:cholestenol delta-isomerase